MSFDEIGALVGGLPRSAREHAAWWQGEPERSPQHVQKQAWSQAGFIVETLELSAERVGVAGFVFLSQCGLG